MDEDLKSNLDFTFFRQTISRFAKNYLPILFNLYIDTPTGKSKMQVDNSFEGDDNKKKSPERLASLETLRLYLPFADEELVARFSFIFLVKFMN